MKFIDLFSGIGGFRLGLERTGHYEHVWSNDINEYANKIYTERFGEEGHYSGDIRGVNEWEIPDHELLCGGFPCQAFSVAGKRKGFEDARGTLFFEICRIIKAKRPHLLLLENVKGLLNHDKGRTFTTILQSLDELGYWLEWQVLNSKNFNVPQNRPRVFIVGHLRGTGGREVFPITRENRYFNETEKQNITTTKTQEPYIKNLPHGYNYGFEKKFPSLKANSGAQYNELLVIPVLTPNRLRKRQNGRRFKTHDEPTFTLTAQDQHGIVIGNRIRRLTPIEWERLQGFPDNWTNAVSESQRYKCLGNAVTVNVIEFLGNMIVEAESK